ncbi:NADH-quinone oxidoreductase subunit C [Candidatus Bathyarchaeota archaeon]|nr:NADH-quinone oxidoreductase subunit C [Candidatus Bathyarchaeota archaeon]MBT7186739.1 NADH-quinone oxidoreductase subunit C [Candidatus Bathyarchaeota archaeon]MBT7345581.1 NADH-quinone oxidoreductase subunit C [Candidatus Bathyarchaeota archaeon]
MSNLSDFISSFEENYGKLVESVEIFEETRASIIAKRGSYIEIAEILRDEYGFVIPIAGGAIDYPEENRMEMNYYLDSPDSDFIVIYRVHLARDDLVLPTMTTVWEAMSFHERETKEMFGIDFEGHENMVALLLPPDWKGGYPLRKDFKGEGVE